MQTETRNELPAGRYEPTVGNARYTVNEKPRVGDLVAIYSRGSYRVARVTKVTPTRIATEYTTEAALKTSRSIYERQLSGGGAPADGYIESVEAKNFEFFTDEANPATRRYYAGPANGNPAKVREAQEIVAEGRDAYIARKVAENRATREARRVEAERRGPLGFLTVTRKTVSLDDEMPVYRVEH